MSTPPAPQSPSSLIELNQTREFTAAERRELMRRWRNLTARGETSRWYTAVAYLWWGFAAFFAISVIAAVQHLKPFEPDLASQLLVAGLGFAIVMTLADRLHWRRVAATYFARRTGDRYLIDETGLKAASMYRTFACEWPGIETIIETDEQLIALISRYNALFIVKAAFENQDVAGFCSELTRRWQQSRTQNAPAT
jgi:hypothetical protein